MVATAQSWRRRPISARPNPTSSVSSSTLPMRTDLPLGIYNNPPRVKSDLNSDHLLRIFKHPNYVVHKESTARVGQVAQILAGKPTVSVMCCDSPNLGLLVPTNESRRPRHCER